MTDRAGSTTVLVGLALPALIAALLVGVDYGSAVTARGGLQKAADTAALAGARELMVISGARGEVAEEAAAAIARATAEALDLKPGSVQVMAAFDPSDGTLSVAIEADVQTVLAEVIAGSAPRVAARAVARPVGDSSLCVIGLANTGVAIQAGQNAMIEAIDCTVFANSTSTQALTLTQQARITAGAVCSAGGYRGQRSALRPALSEDCPQVRDPLAGRPHPSSVKCTYTNRSINHVSAEWSPGVYCGGMYLNNNARVKLKPGVYVLKGGTLNVEGKATLEGAGVTLFLTQGARLNILTTSNISLAAPAAGPTAGVLMFGDADLPPTGAHLIHSNNAHMLLGTIYLPGATVRIGGANPIADQSPWTAIVAGRVHLDGSAKVVLNSRFDDTDVPLPSGLKGPGRDIRLTQ